MSEMLVDLRGLIRGLHEHSLECALIGANLDLADIAAIELLAEL